MSAPPPASVAARASSTMNHLSRTFTIDSSDTPCEAALADQLMLTAEDLIGSGQVDPVYRGLLQSGPDAGAEADTALATAQAAARAELSEVLKQLEREPESDEARTAKFELYETFANTVSTARAATLALWDEVRPEFEGHTAAHDAIEREIKAIDRPQNLGCHDSCHWFVHGMVTVAAQNATLIERVLSNTRTKLELLSKQLECPVCFESFESGGTSTCKPTTLGCAHKVCEECWTQWRAMRGGHAFCPLCRHDDFLSAVLAEEQSPPVLA